MVLGSLYCKQYVPISDFSSYIACFHEKLEDQKSWGAHLTLSHKISLIKVKLGLLFKHISCMGHIPNGTYQDPRTLALKALVWSWHKVGQCQPKFIIWANLAGPTCPIIHTLAFWFHGRFLKGFYLIWACLSCDLKLKVILRLAVSSNDYFLWNLSWINP